MTKPRRLISNLLVSGALVLALTTSPAPGLAEEPGPASIAPPEADAPQLEHARYWHARANAVRERLAAAREELDAANAAVSRMRRRNHPRGAARIQLRKQREEAREAYHAVLHVLEVELPAEARAAGASRHWLNERG